MTTEEKIEYIEKAIQYHIERNEFGVADLQDVCNYAAHAGLDRDTVQSYIALLQSRNLVKSNAVGRAYYITLTN